MQEIDNLFKLNFTFQALVIINVLNKRKIYNESLHYMTSFIPVSVHSITFQNIERRAQPRRTEDRALQHMGSLLACLEHIGDGMILLNLHLRVDYMTGSASRLLKTCKDQISIQNHQLILSDPGKARDLREFAKKAFSSDFGCGGGIHFLSTARQQNL
jgi:hypothetical protein